MPSPPSHEGRLYLSLRGGRRRPGEGDLVRKKADNETMEALRAVPLFSICNDKELSAIALAMKEVSFEAGRDICREGETGVGMHVIVEGDVKVEIGGEMKRRMGPGAFFGEVALLDGGPRSATVTAESPVRTLALTSWDFKPLLQANGELAVKMLEEVCRRLRTEPAPEKQG